jgi:predicted type IV restriction endonuclease
MSLEATLKDVTARLRETKFANEQAISQGVVLRIMQELGWDTWDTTIVWPEYQTGEGRVDFALCHPASKPAVFIEVKQPGRAEEGIRQSLEYAFHTGVPFVTLTDGQTWSFYLPAEQGSYEDRRVHKLDLFERPATEAQAVLERYLLRSRVESGEGLETARNEYRSRNRRAQARTAIPSAWREMVEKGDEVLVDLLSEAVESKTGIRPVQDDVAEFLAGLGQVTVAPFASGTTGPAPTVSARNKDRPSSSDTVRRGTLIMRGKSYEYSNAKDAMVTVLRELAKDDPSFLERCALHPDAQGRKRRYIARTAEELYPDRPDLREYRESLPGGWLVATNLNNILKKTIIRVAAETAKLEFGKDVAVGF